MPTLEQATRLLNYLIVLSQYGIKLNEDEISFLWNLIDDYRTYQSDEDNLYESEHLKELDYPSHIYHKYKKNKDSLDISVRTEIAKESSRIIDSLSEYQIRLDKIDESNPEEGSDEYYERCDFVEAIFSCHNDLNNLLTSYL
jgi:hypothetical protein